MQPTTLSHQPAQAKRSLTASAPMTARQVLVVDNNPSLASYIQSLVHGEGHHVLLTTEVLGAWRQIAAAPPDLIVLNAESVLGAFPWLACLKTDRATAAIPVIVVAENHHMPNLLCALDLAADDYLPIEDLQHYLVSSIAQLFAARSNPWAALKGLSLGA